MFHVPAKAHVDRAVVAETNVQPRSHSHDGVANRTANAGGGGSVSSDANQYFNGGTATTAGYTGSWLRRTLDLQNKLDYDEPLAKATFIMTHNSYNSAAYRTAVSYLDPNHNISIDAQLSAGVRSIELDVHRYFSMSGWPWEWKTRLLLCHGQSNHTWQWSWSLS